MNAIDSLDPDINLPTQSNCKYYSIQDFNDDNNISVCTTNNYISALHCNIRSLNANFDSLSQMLHQLNHNFSIIGLSETKINSSKPQFANTSLSGYKFISQPTLSNAGGVGFYVNENLSFHLRSDFSKTTVDFESLWIELQSSLHHIIIIGVIYRHPNSDTQSFLSYLNNVLQNINNENKYCMVLGDFNFNLLNFDSHSDTNEFLNILGSFFFSPHILQPTRITDHTATLIDNIFLNSVSHHTISGNLTYDLTDHLPNFIILNKFSVLPKNFSIFQRDYSNYNESSLIHDVECIDWDSELGNCNNASVMFDTFYSKLTLTVNAHVPLKQISKRKLKEKAKPWITKGIKKSLMIKNKYYKKFIKTKSLYWHHKFKQYRTKLNHIIKHSKKTYYNDYFMKYI